MNPTREEQLALLRLYFSPRLGKISLKKLLEHFGSAQSALTQPWNTAGISAQLEPLPHQEKVIEEAEKEWEWLQKNECKIISVLDSAYPPLLKNIHGAPGLLFARGNFHDWENKVPIAFVGTRRSSEYGKQVVEKLIHELSEYPVVIVSGFALGLDAYAHAAALKANLPTVGVLGTGLQYIYPKENEKLYYKILEKGLFLTEYSNAAPPHAGHFPERNRIISGVSQAVVLVETPEKSGALITAEFALEQGREVLAVPGSIFSNLNKGCHQLIQQGAKLVGSAKDILDELGMESVGEENELLDEVIAVELDDLERSLFVKMTHEPLHIDKIKEISNLPSSHVAGSLTSLILKGLIKELPGKFFMKN